MILVPQRYSPETLIRRLENSEVFGIPWSKGQYKFSDGEIYPWDEPHRLRGPYRQVARPTHNVKKPEVSYEGKYLRTLIKVIATSPENERVALKNGEAFNALIELLGVPSDMGKWNPNRQHPDYRVVRYDFWREGFLPQMFDLDLMSQEYARIFLRRRSEGYVMKGKLPKERREKILRRDSA